MRKTTTAAELNSAKYDAQKQIIAWLRRQFEKTHYVLDGVSNDELVAEYKANHAAQIKRIAQRVADRERLASSQNKATLRRSIASISYQEAPKFVPLSVKNELLGGHFLRSRPLGEK
jgi:hypothetical protein